MPWRLLTTHAAESFDAARQVCAWYRQWYRQRWHVEQVFRALKQDGLDLEASEIETGEGLERLGVLALGAALHVSQLLLAERGEPSGDITEMFDASERACLVHLGATVDGATPKQRNPHTRATLAWAAWAAWVIARLGGWTGYASQHRAGPATYHRGLRRFYDLSAGWWLARQDLYNP